MFKWCRAINEDAATELLRKLKEYERQDEEIRRLTRIWTSERAVDEAWERNR